MPCPTQTHQRTHPLTPPGCRRTHLSYACCKSPPCHWLSTPAGAPAPAHASCSLICSHIAASSTSRPTRGRCCRGAAGATAPSAALLLVGFGVVVVTAAVRRDEHCLFFPACAHGRTACSDAREGGTRGTSGQWVKRGVRGGGRRQRRGTWAAGTACRQGLYGQCVR